ncbi:MAG: hypothetical protein JJU46_07745 [Balneolaceae bacterium]|nr:hypothetical protein [Balneolaceae bacterium]MCH8549390.1 hypothetical protein [Balneolaceae bacterium]
MARSWLLVAGSGGIMCVDREFEAGWTEMVLGREFIVYRPKTTIPSGMAHG